MIIFLLIALLLVIVADIARALGLGGVSAASRGLSRAVLVFFLIAFVVIGVLFWFAGNWQLPHSQ